MNFSLSEQELKIFNLTGTAFSISELAKKTGLTKGYISRTVSSLKDKGFVEVSRKGITSKVILSNNQHALKLISILNRRSYMPIIDVLKDSGIKVLAVLSSGNADFTSLKEESGLSDATLHRWIRTFKQHAMLLSKKDEYELSRDLADIKEFLNDYCSFYASRKLKEIAPGSNYIVSKGFEFLFTCSNEIIHENIRSTGLSSISEEVPLMLSENYYFYTTREFPPEEIAVHAIACDRFNKRNLTYVILYIIKLNINKPLFLKKAKRYGLEEIVTNILKLLETGEKPGDPYIPDPEYIKEKLKEYKIKWHE